MKVLPYPRLYLSWNANLSLRTIQPMLQGIAIEPRQGPIADKTCTDKDKIEKAVTGL